MSSSSAISTTTSNALPYNEPTIDEILIYASFLLALNLVNYILDRFVYCGLIGQILIGVAWGTPAAKWLTVDVESTLVGLGYIGLILLVYGGGLSTSFATLKATLVLSMCIAITGVAAPIGLSFVLQKLVNATRLQAFAAGAALCSTSLGTTFAVLSSSGLASSRLGVVLSTAAMMDDVFGLVIIQVISNLGVEAPKFKAATVVRPVLTSLAFAVSIPLFCLFVVRPVTLWLNQCRKRDSADGVNELLAHSQTVFLLHSVALLGMVAAGSYAGTSNLFTAYLTGATISWWDSELPHPLFHTNNENKEREHSDQAAVISAHDQSRQKQLTGRTSGMAIYEQYYGQVVNKILKPFFFASIGFAIPISQLFSGRIVWRGLVYGALMCFGKLVCGIWLLLPFELRLPSLKSFKSLERKLLTLERFRGKLNRGKRRSKSCQDEVASAAAAAEVLARDGRRRPSKQEHNSGITRGNEDGNGSIIFYREQDSSEVSHNVENEKKDTRDKVKSAAPIGISIAAADTAAAAAAAGPTNHNTTSRSFSSPPQSRRRSLYAASIVGCAMVARGEIGFLVSSIAQDRGIFQSARPDGTSDDDVYLVVTWAILLCTIIGPIGVGVIMKRIEWLERNIQDRKRDEPYQSNGSERGEISSSVILGDWISKSTY